MTVMKTPRQALAEIANLRVQDLQGTRWLYADQVQAILANVEPEPVPTQTVDRDAVWRIWADWVLDQKPGHADQFVNEVLALLQPDESG